MIRGLFILLVLFSIASPAFAVEPGEADSLTIRELLLFYDLEELTSVSFFPTVSRKAPGYSYVITNEQIEKTPERTLDDIIAMRVPGMTTGRHERTGSLIGTRGILIDNNAKTMVMLDDQQINQRSHFGYSTGLLSPLLGDIKQVEMILGPGAILHGSGALNGFINLVPKNGKDNPGAFINSEYGFAEQLWKIEAGYGASYGENRNVYLYGGMYDAEGFEPDELFGSTKTFDMHSNGFDDGNKRLSLYWNHDKFNLNTFYYENNPYKNNSVEIGSFHQATLGLRPKYIFEISNTDSVEVIGSALWFDHRSPGGPLPPAGIVTDRGGSERHWDLKNIYRTTRWDHNSLATGFSYGEKRFFQKKQFFSGDAETWLGTVDTEWQEASIFAEDVIVLSNSWNASTGLRYDKIYLSEISSTSWTENKKPDNIKGHCSPRIASAYDLDANTTVKASYQHGFRAPDAFYYQDYLTYRDAARSLDFDFPDNLKIETLDSYEFNFQKNFPEKKIKFNCNVFYNIFKDLLSFQFYKASGLFSGEEVALIKAAAGVRPQVPDIGSFLNEEDILRARGGEVGATFQPVSNTEVRLNYGYVYSNADQIRYPTHQIKLNIMSYFFNNKLAVGLDYLYNSRYSKSNLPVADDVYRNDRHLVDVSLLYNITKDFSIKLIANNLFENDTPPMVFTPERPQFGGLGFDERRIYVSFMLKL